MRHPTPRQAPGGIATGISIEGPDLHKVRRGWAGLVGNHGTHGSVEARSDHHGQNFLLCILLIPDLCTVDALHHQGLCTGLMLALKPQGHKGMQSVLRHARMYENEQSKQNKNSVKTYRGRQATQHPSEENAAMSAAAHCWKQTSGLQCARWLTVTAEVTASPGRQFSHCMKYTYMYGMINMYGTHV